MAENSGSKPWWESQLDWNLPDSLHDTLRMGRHLLRNIPSTLSAYKLGKSSPVDHLEPDPVEKIGSPKPAAKQSTTRPMPRIIQPPPPPPLPPRPITLGLPRAVNMPAVLPASSQAIALPASNNPLPTVRQTMVAVRPDAVAQLNIQQPIALPHGPARVGDRLDAARNESVVKQIPGPAPAAKDIEKQKPAEETESRKLTLENLLDPDYVDYR